MVENKERVALHIYDLSQGLARQISFSLIGKTLEAIYHTGVVVYGREYSFGAGIDVEPLGLSRYGTPIQVLELGYTEVPQELFEQYLEEIRPRYSAETYSLLRHNCNNFSDEVLQFLVGVRVPDHILNLPSEVLSTPFGASLVPMLEQIEASARARALQSAPMPSFPSGPLPDFASVQVPSDSTTPASVTAFHSAEEALEAIPPPVVLTPSATSANSFSRAEVASSAGQPAMPPQSQKRSSTQPTSESKGGDSAQAVASVRPISTPSLESNVGTTSQTSPSSAMATGDKPSKLAEAEVKAKVHSEIQREFALLMAAGQLQANEAAVQAVRIVMDRNRAAGTIGGSGQPQA